MGEIGLDNATISLVVPYPGTPAYARLYEEGRILDRDWRHYNGKTHVVYRPRHMTPDELMAGYEPDTVVSDSLFDKKLGVHEAIAQYDSQVSW